MASTTATGRQSEAIRAAMREIRSELPYDVDDARARVKQLSDWKYHVSQRPFVVLLAAAAVGYLLVPAKRRGAEASAQAGRGQPAAEPAKRGMLAGLVGTLTTLALRQAAGVASRQIASRFSLGSPRRPAARPLPPSTHPEVPR